MQCICERTDLPVGARTCATIDRSMSTANIRSWAQQDPDNSQLARHGLIHLFRGRILKQLNDWNMLKKNWNWYAMFAYMNNFLFSCVSNPEHIFHINDLTYFSFLFSKSKHSRKSKSMSTDTKITVNIRNNWTKWSLKVQWPAKHSLCALGSHTHLMIIHNYMRIAHTFSRIIIFWLWLKGCKFVNSVSQFKPDRKRWMQQEKNDKINGRECVSTVHRTIVS